MKKFSIQILSVLASLFIFIYIVSTIKETKDIPQIINCEITEQIFIEFAKGEKWPTGNVVGCRCYLQYDGRIYIDYMNRDRTFCTTRE